MSDPAPGNALIKADNPKMSDEQIAFGIEQLKALKVLDGGDAQTMGIGIITEARWKATYDFMVAAGLLKPEVDWKQGFTDRFVKTPQALDVTRRRPGRAWHLTRHFAEDAGGRGPLGAPVVEILSADKVFPNGTRALAPIDLTIAAGEFLTLIGPSGCGKSTLLKLIANLIEPSDGRILWWSGAFDKVGSSGRSLAFVFQDPTLMPWARVETNVRLPLDLARVPKAESRAARGGGARRASASRASRGTIRGSCPAA